MACCYHSGPRLPQSHWGSSSCCCYCLGFPGQAGWRPASTSQLSGHTSSPSPPPVARSHCGLWGSRSLASSLYPSHSAWLLLGNAGPVCVPPLAEQRPPAEHPAPDPLGGPGCLRHRDGGGGGDLKVFGNNKGERVLLGPGFLQARAGWCHPSTAAGCPGHHPGSLARAHWALLQGHLQAAGATACCVAAYYGEKEQAVS